MKKVIICIVSVIIIIFVALFLSTGGARTDANGDGLIGIFYIGIIY